MVERTYNDLCWKNRMLDVLKRMKGRSKLYSSWITPEMKSMHGRNTWRKSCNIAQTAVSKGFCNCGSFSDEMRELFQLITNWTESSYYRLSGKILAEAFTLTFPNRDANDGPIDLMNKWNEYAIVVGHLDKFGRVVGKNTVSFESPSKQQCFDSVLQAYIGQDETPTGRWDIERLLCSTTQENLTTEFFDFAGHLL